MTTRLFPDRGPDIRAWAAANGGRVYTAGYDTAGKEIKFTAWYCANCGQTFYAADYADAMECHPACD